MTIEIPDESDLVRDSRGRPPRVNIGPLLHAAEKNPRTGIRVTAMTAEDARSAIRQIRKLGGYHVSQRRRDEDHLDVYIKKEQS